MNGYIRANASHVLLPVIDELSRRDDARIATSLEAFGARAPLSRCLPGVTAPARLSARVFPPL